jgi:putative transposase
MVAADHAGASTPTASALLRRIDARLDEQYGPGVVLRPSTATAYRHLGHQGHQRGEGKCQGQALHRRPAEGYLRKLRAMRPGEYAILDTQDLDVFAMEPVTCRWVRAQLTVSQDLLTRCITGLRVTRPADTTRSSSSCTAASCGPGGPVAA